MHWKSSVQIPHNIVAQRCYGAKASTVTIEEDTTSFIAATSIATLSVATEPVGDVYVTVRPYGTYEFNQLPLGKVYAFTLVRNAIDSTADVTLHGFNNTVNGESRTLQPSTGVEVFNSGDSTGGTSGTDILHFIPKEQSSLGYNTAIVLANWVDSDPLDPNNPRKKYVLNGPVEQQDTSKLITAIYRTHSGADYDTGLGSILDAEGNIVVEVASAAQCFDGVAYIGYIEGGLY